MLKDEPITTNEGLRAAIARVTFGPSCLDMGWTWELQDIAIPDGPRLVNACRIRCSFQRPDTTSGKVERGFGRWWIVEPGITESALWKTMYAAAKMIVEHEPLEAFRVDGVRPFNPHRTIQDLIATEPAA